MTAETKIKSAPLNNINPLLIRISQPKNWSLRTRLVYTTGAILVLGALITLGSISITLNKSAEESILDKLDSFEHLLQRQSNEILTKDLTIAAQLASTDKITFALQSKNRTELRESVSPISATVRKATGSSFPPTQFFGNNAEPLFHSMSTNPLGDSKRTKFLMTQEVETQQQAISGTQLLPSGLYLSATVPVFILDDLVGSIETSTSYEEVFKTLNVKAGMGMTVLIHSAHGEIKNNLKQYDSFQNHTVLLNLGTTNITDFDESLILSKSPYQSRGNLFTKTLELQDFRNKSIGKIVLFYDGTTTLAKSKTTIIALSLMTFIGVLCLSLSLYWNVNRIKKFFKQMRKVLIASHSNDFSERIDITTIHCLDVLNCGHKECPVYNDPTRVCYLETGDEAISPKFRNSCIFLNKYTSCKNCPVYKMHHGDELMEMHHVVNTMMRLWSDFLGSVGTLLSDVFRSDTGTIPSLDGVSGYLTQMARLTSYGHDLQGVYNEDEVYQQLEWIFETEFNLARFNLFKINTSENKMEPVLNRVGQIETNIDVLFNCELCRCKRVAEDVISDNSPFLCPYFGIDTNTHVRCCLPMVMGGQVGAVFTFIVEKPEWKQKKTDIGIMKKYLDETAPILSSLRLLQASKEQALKDPLTKCHNRRFMDEYLAQFEKLNERQRKKIGFIMADLDHFKMVNDEFGHLAGDDVLKQLADIIRKTIRKSDILIRYGGEEFLILLLEIEQDGVSYDIAEKIRVAVEEAKLTLPSGGSIKKTLSMGVAEHPVDGDQLYQVIKYADVALYQAKSQGRNKVLRFTKEMWKTEDY
ncbi:MAG: diguanylate cyclase [Desulfotalea sp.]